MVKGFVDPKCGRDGRVRVREAGGDCRRWTARASRRQAEHRKTQQYLAIWAPVFYLCSYPRRARVVRVCEAASPDPGNPPADAHAVQDSCVTSSSSECSIAASPSPRSRRHFRREREAHARDYLADSRAPHASAPRPIAGGRKRGGHCSLSSPRTRGSRAAARTSCRVCARLPPRHSGALDARLRGHDTVGNYTPRKTRRNALRRLNPRPELRRSQRSRAASMPRESRLASSRAPSQSGRVRARRAAEQSPGKSAATP